jgi:hypothetical protein
MRGADHEEVNLKRHSLAALLLETILRGLQLPWLEPVMYRMTTLKPPSSQNCRHEAFNYGCGEKNLLRIYGHLLVVIVLSFPLSAKAASLTVFAVANQYCEKRELGMSQGDAIDAALYYVMFNSMFEPDYKLPNFNKLVISEIFRQCPQYDFAPVPRAPR